MCSPYRPSNSACYWIRKRVPEDLVPIIGKREFKKSLGTRDPDEARRLAPIMCATFDQIIASARRGLSVRPDDLDGIQAEHYRRELEKLTAEALRDQWCEGAFDAESESRSARLDPPELHSDLSEDEYDDRREEHVATLMDPVLRAWETETRTTLPPVLRKRLAQRLVIAEDLALTGAAQQALTGQSPDHPLLTNRTPVLRERLSDLWADFEHFREQSGRQRRITDQWKRYVFHCCAYMKGKPANEISRQELFAYADSLRAGKGLRDRAVSTKTINDSYLASIKSLLTWAVERGRVSQNPAEKVALKPLQDESVPLRPYKSSEVAKILIASREVVPNEDPMTTVYRWAPWLMAFTGARLAEVLNIRRDAIRNENGIPCVEIWPSEEGRQDGGTPGKGDRGKSSNARRVIPLHPALITEGLLGYVESLSTADPWLFPGSWSDKYNSRSKVPGNKLRKRIQTIVPPQKGERLQPCHGFRHWVAHELKREGVHSDFIEAFEGRSADTVGKRYGRPSLEALYEMVSKIQNPASDAPQ